MKLVVLEYHYKRLLFYDTQEQLSLVSIHVLAGRTTALHAYDVWTPMITADSSFHYKSLRARNKLAHVELLRGLCRDML